MRSVSHYYSATCYAPLLTAPTAVPLTMAFIQYDFTGINA